MSPTVEPNEPNAFKDSVEVSPTRRAVLGAAGAGIVSAALPSAVSAASAGGAEGLSSGTGIIGSAVQGPSNTTVTPTAVSVSGVNYNVYRFTSSGSFSVSGGSLNADVLLIGGGGGGGGGYFGGGGGGGEVLPLYSKSFVAGNYVVTVGQGGAAGADGNPSKIASGAGATWESEARKGLKGGNGTETSDATGGKSGDQFNGGVEANGAGGGGGGSTAPGSNGFASGGVYNGGAGGAGETVNGFWTAGLSAGGGGGGGGYTSGGTASDGGGAGGRGANGFGSGTAGTAGTGGGGGGAYDGNGSAGGSGAIYVRILA